GRTATFTYNSVSGDIRLTNIEDVYGINSSFQYDTIGRIDAYTTPYGTTAFELSDFDMGSYSLIRYIESTDPQGDKERIEYNLSASQTGIPGVINEPLPDSSIVNYFIYDNDDRNSFFWDKQQMEYGEGDYSKAHLYHWIQPGSYDAATGILESEKPPLEGRVWYNYPGQTQPYIQGTIDLPSVIGRVVYDENNNIVTQASTFEYNLLGYITREIDPVGRETKYEYDTNGVDILFIKQKVGVGPVYETIESRTYDPTDPPYVPRTVTDASGNTTTFSYNTYGQIQTITNELNEVITYTYETDPAKNGFGKVLSVTGDVPGGNVTYTYDSFDRIRTKTDSEGHTLTYDYDNLDRVTVITYPDSSFEQFDYQNHSLVATRDREGRWTRNFHNSLNQKVATIDPQSRLLQYEWCLCGHLRKLIDGEGSITHWKRDLQGRVKEKIFDDGTKYQYNYDFAGRLETITDPLNQTKTMSYYLDDQLKSVDYSDPETPDLSYTYDTYYLRQSTMVDGIGTTTYHYVPVSGTDDGALQVARMDGPFTDDTLKYTYDELGRVKKHEIVDDATFTIASHTETYQYDSRGRLDDITNDLGYFDYTYIGQSNRVDTIDYPNGMQIDYDYFTDTLDFKLKQIKNLNAAATPAVISQFDYTYRQDRNIQTWTTNQNNVTKTWTFDYNNSKELTSTIRRDSGQNELESYSYAYDRAGNRIHSANDSNRSNGIANALNQIEQYQEHGLTLFSGTLDEAATVEINSQTAAVISDGGNPPEYRFEALVDLAEGSNTVTIEATDGSNNTTTKTYSVTASGITKLMEYDANGNLRYERNPDQTVIREFQWDQENRLVKIINADNSSSEFAYNGQSKRVRIIEKNTSGTTTSNQVFIWCGPRLCQKRDSAGTTISRDYFSLGYQEGASTYFYTKDHLGSIREVVASDGITTSAIYDYSAWGTQSLLAGTKVSDFGYTGHYEHQPSDLTLTWFRAYDSQTGRWLSRDPIAENGGINLYAYVGGNPIGLKDPFGLEECLTLTGSEYGDKLFKQGYEMQLKVYSCVYGCLIGLGYDEAKTSAIIETMANAPKSSNNAVQCVSRGARFLGNLFKRIPAGVGVALSGYSYANCLTKCELSH
ncbi:MAG: RHS repeat-associated core domain-containing protein, partial [Verrucomicrobiota bacterium]